MKKIILILVLVVGLFAENKAKFYEPYFSCSKVKEGSIEYKICIDEELSNLDKKLSKVYSNVQKTLPNVLQKTYKIGQRSWIKKRNKCENEECLKDSYESRVEYLTKLLPKNKAFSPYLVFELINLFECNKQDCNKPIQKEMYKALMNRKNIKILDPIAWGNSLEDAVFKKYLDGMSEYMKNKISHVGLKQDERYRSMDTFNYYSDSLKDSMEKGDAMKAMCNFKLYEIDYNYYDNIRTKIIEDGKAFLMFADATMSQEEILKKDKTEYAGSLISIINQETLQQDNTHQFRRENTTNCYKATKTIAGIFLFEGIYYHFESLYFSSDDSYGMLRIVFIQKDDKKFHGVMGLRMKKELR